MDGIRRHYDGKTTSQGYQVQVTHGSGELVIGLKNQGEFSDEYGPFVRVATIENEGDGFRAHWFHLDAEESTETTDYPDERALIAALDRRIEQRSREVEKAED